MQVPIKIQSQEETSARSLKYKDTGHGFLKFFLSLLVVGTAILVSIIYGKALISHMTPENTYSSNQVEIIKQENQIITASIAEQRASIHSMEVRMVDQNLNNEQRFLELEGKILKLEEQIQKAALIEQYKSHRVIRGETLWRISMQYYGTGQYVHELARYNNLVNPRLIISGSTLKIPPVTTFQ